jgi:hypothetical protein
VSASSLGRDDMQAGGRSNDSISARGQQGVSAHPPGYPAAAAAAVGIEPQAEARHLPARESRPPPAPGAAAATAMQAAPGTGSTWDAPPPSVAAAAGVARVTPAELDAGPSDLVFLEGVVLWWCGLPEGSPEQVEMLGVLCQYAGHVYPDLCSSITHILVSGVKGFCSGLSYE